jgi:hypothetical protein
VTNPPGSKVDLIDRIGRPLLRLCGVLFVVILLWFLFRVMLAILTAFDRAASEGTSVPDMSGGLASILTPVLASIPIIIPMAIDQITRHRERRDQIARGTQPPPLASPPSPEPSSPTGGLVNNQAIQ